ncbi:unnamed protein product [Toxocara canis]|uniref:G_PROTEIN_RECEP_F1_2 domain-containing protein n=1 Tax=Toxocara canis TaxID=6265 RepID=A0A183U450_TOXCA|nr:unnamed protein product [Toxocara canis]
MTEFQISTTINPPTPNGTAMSPQHLENERMLRSFIYFLDGYVTLFVVLIGISFNTFCMLIFQRMNRGKFSLAQYYLVIFLACQTALLCNCFLIYSLPTILYGDTRIKGPYSYVILIAHAFSGPSYIAITWIVLALTVERCFALQKPFAYRAMAKASRVKRIIIGLLVAAFIFCIPRLFEYKIVTECESNPLDTSTDTVNSTTCFITTTSTELLQVSLWLFVIRLSLVNEYRQQLFKLFTAKDSKHPQCEIQCNIFGSHVVLTVVCEDKQ